MKLARTPHPMSSTFAAMNRELSDNLTPRHMSQASSCLTRSNISGNSEPVAEAAFANGPKPTKLAFGPLAPPLARMSSDEKTAQPARAEARATRARDSNATKVAKRATRPNMAMQALSTAPGPRARKRAFVLPPTYRARRRGAEVCACNHPAQERMRGTEVPRGMPEKGSSLVAAVVNAGVKSADVVTTSQQRHAPLCPVVLSVN